MVDIIDKNIITFWKFQHYEFIDTMRLVRHHRRQVTLIPATSPCVPGESPRALKCQVRKLIHLVAC